LAAAALFLSTFSAALAAEGGVEYAVKFVCGPPNTPVVAPGNYFTAINVHNPHDQPVNFTKKVAIALPGERAGPISRFFEAKLNPDEALEIDCPDILAHANTKTFLKGFVVIRSPAELDVVAVYTAGHPQVETLRVERVAPRSLSTPDVVKADAEACPPNVNTAHDAVGGLGCCCNKPKIYPPAGPSTWWPDCRPGLVCVGNLSGPGIPANTYAICANAPGGFTTPSMNSSQPAFCGQR
jgi:hypothetical protein